MSKLIKNYNTLTFRVSKIKMSVASQFFISYNFINNYLIINELVWQEGLLIDFLQKKTVDNWIKKFVILSANLFNERLVFDRLIKFYLNLFIWPLHKLFIFEFNNVSGIISVILIFFFIFFLFFFYFFFLMF